LRRVARISCRAVHSGALPAHRLRRRVLIEHTDLIEWVKSLPIYAPRVNTIKQTED